MLALLLVLAAAAAGAWWVRHPLPLAKAPLELSIEPGTLPRGVAQAVRDAGVAVDPRVLFLFFRLSGQAHRIRAGSYQL